MRNKTDGQWYELTRAFTPYGNAFNSSWSKTFWIDVSEYSFMLSGDTEFRLYYGGFDATPTRSHSVRLDFNLYEGKPSKKSCGHPRSTIPAVTAIPATGAGPTA